LFILKLGIATTVVVIVFDILLPVFGSLDPLGGAMLAVLVKVPVVVVVPVIVKSRLPPFGKVGIKTLLKVVKPAVDGHTAPPDAEQEIVTPVRDVGTRSFTIAP